VQKQYCDALIKAKNEAMDAHDLNDANAIQQAITALEPSLLRTMQSVVITSPRNKLRRRLIGTTWRQRGTESTKNDVQFLADGKTNAGGNWAVIDANTIVVGRIAPSKRVYDGTTYLALWTFSRNDRAEIRPYVAYSYSQTFAWELVQP